MATRHTRHILAFALIALLGASMPASAQEAPLWTPEILDLFAALPVQEGGRVKPLDTYAQFALLSMNGTRTLRTADGEKRSHLEWLLDCWFFPEIAKNHPCFLVNSYDAIDAMGLQGHDRKRDRYTYAELFPGRAELGRLAGQYQDIDQAQLSPQQRQILDLAHNMVRFEELIGFLDFARARFGAPEDSALGAALGGETIPASRVMETLRSVAHQLSEHGDQLSAEQTEAQMRVLQQTYQEWMHALNRAHGLALVPNPDPKTREWVTLGELPAVADNSGGELAAAELLAKWESMAANASGFLPSDGADGARAAFLAALNGFRDVVVPMADARGEYGAVPLEVFFYKSKLLFYAQWLYVLSFVLVALFWLAPDSRVLRVLVPVSLSVPTLLLIAGITLRCIIRGRPPVTTLYETLLFVTAIVVLVSLAAEYINRRRIAISMGAFLGMFGLFLAFRYEAKEGVDTMPSLVAVLDTNFWLATHVTTVTMGYAACLLAGALAHVYIAGRLLGVRRGVPEFYRGLTRMVYGIVCFGVFFATIGTVLGGIWANDSWGRFWGWDPKENGALLIVLWGLLILHARLGGYIRDLGIHMNAIFLGMIVAFSWWGTNLLGVGLHSYGFTHGIWRALIIFWGIESVVILLGGAIWLMDRANGARPPDSMRQNASSV